jgi:hypothetical protein
MTIYLYIKTHNGTGLKYFGKTTKKDPHKYTGSGKYWKRHLKKHGSDFTTEIIASFQDDDSCKEFALNFSKENDIVDSPNWANLQEENGLDGAPVGHEGHKFTQEQLQKISESSKQRWADPEFKKMMNEKRKWSDKRKQEQSARLTGTKRPEHSALMKLKPIPENFRCLERTEDHKAKIAEALKGKPKSDAHKQNLSKPKPRVCRIHDRKEISINAYSRWLNLFLVHEVRV